MILIRLAFIAEIPLDFSDQRVVAFNFYSDVQQIKCPDKQDTGDEKSEK